MICPHKRLRSLVLFLEPNSEQTHRVAVMTVRCHECGQEFEVVGTPEISANRRELWVGIVEARKEKWLQ